MGSTISNGLDLLVNEVVCVENKEKKMMMYEAFKQQQQEQQEQQQQQLNDDIDSTTRLIEGKEQQEMKARNDNMIVIIEYNNSNNNKQNGNKQAQPQQQQQQKLVDKQSVVPTPDMASRKLKRSVTSPLSSKIERDIMIGGNKIEKPACLSTSNDLSSKTKASTALLSSGPSTPCVEASNGVRIAKEATGSANSVDSIKSFTSHSSAISTQSLSNATMSSVISGASSQSISSSSSPDKMMSLLSDTKSSEIELKKQLCFDQENNDEKININNSVNCSSGNDSSLIRKPKKVNISKNIHSFTPFKLLGKGSHGEVFLGLDKVTYKPYAIKALCIEDVIERGELEHTLTEIRVHKKLSRTKYPCPFVTAMRWAFHNDTHIFLVFDFMEGGELYRHLCIRGILPENLVRFYAAEICIAIGYLHAIGVIYRDLKPENLCLDSKGHIHIIDLGLCKDGMMMNKTIGKRSKSKNNNNDFDEKDIKDDLNELCGTTEYLAPEILKLSGYGYAADWWSFGMVIYEMLTGLPPWYSDDQTEMIEGILNKSVNIPPNMSEHAKDLILKLLDKDRKRRLGAKEGAKEIMSHPFFKEVEWVKLAKKGVQPPFTPPVSGADMVNNFDSNFTRSKITCLMGCFTPNGLIGKDEYNQLIEASQFDYENDTSEDDEGNGNEND